MYRQIAVLNLLMAALIFQSCRQQQPDVSIGINRMEQSMFNVPVDSIRDYIPRLEQQYGELFDLFSIYTIGIGSPKNPLYPEKLAKFLTDPDINLAYKKVTETYPDLKFLETGLNTAFSNYRREFPDGVIPSVYTIMSGFNESMITSDSILAISLDKYLGKDEDFYYMLQIHSYQQRLMERKYLLSDCMKAWIYAEFPFENPVYNVLNNILYEGKVMYAVHQLLPETPDSIIFGFTPQQMRWCNNNTAQMWMSLVENRLLFSTDKLTINKFIGPAPYTAAFEQESPGRAAVWLGYKIIAAYMKRNRDSLDELLRNNDYQQILDKARFKP